MIKAQPSKRRMILNANPAPVFTLAFAAQKTQDQCASDAAARALYHFNLVKTRTASSGACGVWRREKRWYAMHRRHGQTADIGDDTQ